MTRLLAHLPRGTRKLYVGIAKSVFFLASLAVVGCNTTGSIEVVHDRFTNTDVVSLAYLRVDDVQITMGSALGGTPFMFVAVSSDAPIFLHCRNVDALIDGKAFPLGDGEYEGNVLNGRVEESLKVDLTMEAVQAIVHAASLEARACQRDFRFQPPQLAKVQEFLRIAHAPGTDRRPARE